MKFPKEAEIVFQEKYVLEDADAGTTEASSLVRERDDGAIASAILVQYIGKFTPALIDNDLLPKAYAFLEANGYLDKGHKPSVIIDFYSGQDTSEDVSQLNNPTEMQKIFKLEQHSNARDILRDKTNKVFLVQSNERTPFQNLMLHSVISLLLRLAASKKLEPQASLDNIWEKINRDIPLQK